MTPLLLRTALTLAAALLPLLGAQAASAAPRQPVTVTLSASGDSGQVRLSTPSGPQRLRFEPARGVASVLRQDGDGHWLSPAGVLRQDGLAWRRRSPGGWVPLSPQGLWRQQGGVLAWRHAGHRCQWPRQALGQEAWPAARGARELPQWVAEGPEGQLLALGTGARQKAPGEATTAVGGEAHADPVPVWRADPAGCQLTPLPAVPAPGFAGMLLGSPAGWLLADPDTLQVAFTRDGVTWQRIPMPEGTHQWLGAQWHAGPQGEPDIHVAVSRADLDFAISVYRWDAGRAGWVNLDKASWPAGLSLLDLP